MPASCGEDRLISYDEALARTIGVATVQQTLLESVTDDCEELGHQSSSSTAETDESQPARSHGSTSIFDALGCISTKNILIPHATPKTDTSAMDGFAVCSAETSDASPDQPLRLKVVQCIAAGDVPNTDTKASQGHTADRHICVEIMTGASFPHGRLSHLDAVVKVEDVVDGEEWPDDEDAVSRCVQITAPVKPFQHRRPAGSDFSKNDLLIRAGEEIEPKHIAALASANISRIETRGVPDSTFARPSVPSRPKLKIGILSTGAEVSDIRADTPLPKHKLPDSNGPFLTTSLRNAYPRADIGYLGVVDDNADALHRALLSATLDHNYDVLITSGGVSRGRYDLVRYVVETRMGGRIVFHGVRIRPGAPLLLAVLTIPDPDSHPHRSREVTFFGIPGNPVAAATGLRFFIFPYLQTFWRNGPGHDEAMTCTINLENHPEKTRRKPRHCTAFWLASTCYHPSDSSALNRRAVTVLQDQASYKVKNLLTADTWVEIPEGEDAVQHGQLFHQFPI